MKTLIMPDGTAKHNYTIDSNGNIWYKGEPKATKVGKGHRVYTTMSRISYRVADLVYSTYITPVEDDHVEHRDGNLQNTGLNNLYIVKVLF